MNIRNTIKEITPPILFKTLARFRRQYAAITEVPSGTSEFRSWEDALEQSTTGGYENNKLTKLVYDKTISYRNSLTSGPIFVNNSEIQTITALGVVLFQTYPKDRITVVDFGGACGAHFFLSKSIFTDVNFDWRVVETEGMVKYARNLESDQLHFYTRIEDALNEADRIHLVHSSGTLQCLPEPYSVLEKLVSINAEYILLSRLGVTPGSSEIITIHRHMMSESGPGPAPKDFHDEVCIYPFQYPVKSKIEAILSKGYEILFVNNDPSGKFSFGSHTIIGITYFCKKN